MTTEILFRGTVFEFITNGTSTELQKYILAECYEENFVFQIVCIEGYNAGSIAGYVKEDGFLKEQYKGISKSHLIEEIDRNFLSVIKDSIKIYQL